VDTIEGVRCCFHLLNDALLILLPKKANAATMRNFRPISLIHIIGKLFSKVLASRLATHLDTLISINQSAFVKGRYIQDNFRLGQSSAKLHADQHQPKRVRERPLYSR
jgi:hypothetical protein